MIQLPIYVPNLVEIDWVEHVPHGEQIGVVNKHN